MARMKQTDIFKVVKNARKPPKPPVVAKPKRTKEQILASFAAGRAKKSAALAADPLDKNQLFILKYGDARGTSGVENRPFGSYSANPYIGPKTMTSTQAEKIIADGTVYFPTATQNIEKRLVPSIKQGIKIAQGRGGASKSMVSKAKNSLRRINRSNILENQQLYRLISIANNNYAVRKKVPQADRDNFNKFYSDMDNMFKGQKVRLNKQKKTNQ